MALIRVKPTAADVAIANEIASNTGPRAEHAAEALTWGADEHVLCALAPCWWLYSRSADKASRRASGHVLLKTLVASALAHHLKAVFDQERPDRLTIQGHMHGISIPANDLMRFPPGTRWRAILPPVCTENAFCVDDEWNHLSWRNDRATTFHSGYLASPFKSKIRLELRMRCSAIS
jgi:hypothetical protein